MATELLPINNTAATSADFTVPALGQRIVYLKGGGQLRLQLKEGADYYTVDTLTPDKAAGVLQGGDAVMTYRVKREEGESAGAAYA